MGSLGTPLGGSAALSRGRASPPGISGIEIPGRRASGRVRSPETFRGRGPGTFPTEVTLGSHPKEEELEDIKRNLFRQRESRGFLIPPPPRKQRYHLMRDFYKAQTDGWKYPRARKQAFFRFYPARPSISHQMLRSQTFVDFFCFLPSEKTLATIVYPTKSRLGYQQHAFS